MNKKRPGKAGSDRQTCSNVQCLTDLFIRETVGLEPGDSDDPDHDSEDNGADPKQGELGRRVAPAHEAQLNKCSERSDRSVTSLPL